MHRFPRTLGLAVVLVTAAVGLAGCGPKTDTFGQTFATLTPYPNEQATSTTPAKPKPPPLTTIGSFVTKGTGQDAGTTVTSTWAVGVPHSNQPVPQAMVDGCTDLVGLNESGWTWAKVKLTMTFHGAVQTDVTLSPEVGQDILTPGFDNDVELADGSSVPGGTIWLTDGENNACNDPLSYNLSPGDPQTLTGYYAVQAISNAHPHISPADTRLWALQLAPTVDDGLDDSLVASGPNAARCAGSATLFLDAQAPLTISAPPGAFEDAGQTIHCR